MCHLTGKSEPVAPSEDECKAVVGEPAPDFELESDLGGKVKLSDLKGKKVVLYFYPKDNTSGCTAEACSLNDNYDTLTAQGYEVVGISPDSAGSHQKFIAKYNLAFNLIADTDKKILEDYGVWAEKSMYGRKYMGVLRTTFIIDEQGIIERVITKVNTKNAAEQILKK